jgi:uncharacterized protein (TIGR02996 family)
MSDEAGFLKAIADQPAERSTRLVYADWLDEHDRPREAEFLRLQIQAAEINERLIELGGQLDVSWLNAVRPLLLGLHAIKNRAGRSLWIDQLCHWGTYERLEEERPTTESNARRIQEIFHSSELVIIWFQDECPFPINPSVREQIRAIDWDRYAVDYDRRHWALLRHR